MSGTPVPAPTPDGGTVEVIRSHLTSAAEQMRRTLIRAAFNPVIYEVLDFGISVYDARLRLIAEAPGITSFLGANDHAVPRLVAHLGPGGLGPGDVALLNYPYWSAAHAYDAMLLAPVFRDGGEEPAAYLAVRAHWMDLGAKAPGYVLDSTDVHQEGLILPGTRIVKGGVVDRELVELIRFNSRLPDQTIGDFHAQLAALRTGERQLHRVWEQFGAATVDAAIDAVIAHGERVARRAVRDLPDGSWTARDWLDDDGITEDAILMQVTVTIAGDEVTVDFDGSSPAVAGPVNVPFGATESLAKTVFKALTTPDEPANAGHYRPLSVRAEPGTLFHAVYPAATFTLWTHIVAFELVHKALAQGLESMAASSGGDEPGFMAVGVDPRDGRDFVVSNNEGVGWGGTPAHDGATGQMHLALSVVRNTPVEVLEHRSTVFHERLELVPDSGGAGRHRGGLGVLRQARFTADGELLSMKKKTMTRPWALHGGHEPEPNRLVVWPGTARERALRMRRVPMVAGERFVNTSAGGGGWGDPLDRDPRRVAEDVLDGYVTPATARQVYGVEVAPDGTPTELPLRTSTDRSRT